MRPLLLRRRASRPQLKRDPLGGALPPYEHSSVTSFAMVNTRGAEPSRAGGRRLAAPHPQRPRYRSGAPRPTIKAQATLNQLSRVGQGVLREARGALDHRCKGAPSNMRLKLTGAIVLMESECSCAGAHELSFNSTAPCGHVARSLSAIR